MTARTDLAVELKARIKDDNGITTVTKNQGNITVTKISVNSDTAAKKLGKTKGNYINIDIPDLLYHGGEYMELENIIIKELNALSFCDNDILIAGLGNRNITPDALGPSVAEKVLATRHLTPYLKRQTGLNHLKNVSVIEPGVLGQTGVETMELIKGVLSVCKAKALLIIDAFAAAEPNRLGTTIQICDSGISPGSGVGNDRKEISKKTIGVPVIAVGVPTCLDAALLGANRTKATPMIVAPREIDMLIDRAASILSNSINCFLQPDIDRNFLLSIV